jgi:hypothetical protein
MRITLVSLVGLALAVASSGCGAGEDDGMLPMPEDSLNSLVVRTDYADDAAWSAVRTAITTPVGLDPVSGEFDFQAFVEFADDRRYEGMTVDQLLARVPEGTHHRVFFVVDRETLTDPEHPVLAVDLGREPGRTFRVIPPWMWDVQNNLAISNTDWESYVEGAGEDEIYRGWEQ